MTIEALNEVLQFSGVVASVVLFCFLLLVIFKAIER